MADYRCDTCGLFYCECAKRAAEMKKEKRTVPAPPPPPEPALEKVSASKDVVYFVRQPHLRYHEHIGPIDTESDARLVARLLNEYAPQVPWEAYSRTSIVEEKVL